MWVGTGSPAAAGVTVAAGVLIDADHLYDYYQQYSKRNYGRIYLPLHAWEYSLVGLGLLALGFNHAIFLGMVLSHLAHVGSDHWRNGLNGFAYSITYRAIKRFESDSIVPHRETARTGHNHTKRFAFDRRLSVWCRAKARSWFMRRANRQHLHNPPMYRADD